MINLNKGVSTSIAITIIVVLAVILVGGVLVYQYYYLPKQELELPAIEIPKAEKADFSALNKDELLHELFPNLYFKNGVADLTAEEDIYSYLNLHLKDSIEDYFTNNQEKSLLLIAQLDGVAHAGGLYHAYLGLFDKNGNLLTPSSLFPTPNYSNQWGSYYEFSEDKAQFGGDEGDFGFYDCKGVKYIAFASAGCPNGSCCFGSVNLFSINKGNFEEIQTIDEQSLASNSFNLQSVVLPSVEAAAGPSYGLKMILSDEKIIIKKVPPVSDSGCLETDYTELKWNKDSCRFE